MFYHHAWAVGSYGSGPTAGYSPNLTQPNLGPRPSGSPCSVRQTLSALTKIIVTTAKIGENMTLDSRLQLHWIIFSWRLCELICSIQDDATPLFKACHKGRADVAKLLLSYGAKHSLLEVGFSRIDLE